MLIAAVLLSKVDLALGDGGGKPALAFRSSAVDSFAETKAIVGSPGASFLHWWDPGAVT